MMNILARILSHGFAIAVVVILAVGYIYRGELFPGMELPAFLYPGAPATTEAQAPAGDVDREEPAAEIAPAEVTGAPASEQAEEMARQQAPVPGPADTGTVSEAGSEPEGTVPDDAPAEVTEEESETMAAPGEPPAETAGEEPEAMAALGEPPAETTGEEPLATVDASEPEVPVVASVDSLQQQPPVPTEDMPAEQEATADVTAPGVSAEPPAPAEDAQPAAGTQETAGAETVTPVPPAAITGTTPPAVDTPARPEATDKSYQLLAMAREAFWMHNYEEAEKKYRDLIALEPDNPDGYGELGNMYFTRGNWQQAAEAYFNAGERLIQSGRLEQAEILVEVIRGLNGKQADELEALLKAASDTDRSQ
jgi:hypothetical protein